MGKFVSPAKPQPRRFYITPEGARYPLYEAPYDYVIPVYKKDRKKAIVADPYGCLIAIGARRDPLILGAYIGSGKDAYIIFRETKMRKAHALHFTINSAAARVRDYFDTHKGEVKTTVKLSAPTAGRTLEHRSKLDKRRATRIKAGEHTVKRRGKPNKTRIVRLGVKHRPHAVIEKNEVTLVAAE